jgi:hypothetical protein
MGGDAFGGCMHDAKHLTTKKCRYGLYAGQLGLQHGIAYCELFGGTIDKVQLIMLIVTSRHVQSSKKESTAKGIAENKSLQMHLIPG